MSTDRLPHRCVADRFRGDTAPTWVVPCTNGWKVHAPYSRLNELTPVISVTKAVIKYQSEE
jgi:hypothetical protein